MKIEDSKIKIIDCYLCHGKKYCDVCNGFGKIVIITVPEGSKNRINFQK
jgi:hypothetical protein